MSQGYQLHFTHQFIDMLTEAVNQSTMNVHWMQRYVLPGIARYPCQGRLLLNRLATNSDNQRLRWQLARRFNCNELREWSENGWLIIYLNKLPQVYFLALIPLPVTGSNNMEEVWQTAN
ncbi:hypothetical protein LPW36_14885 [Jinshanibacter sp. LJY008]|uniref:Uncharacterized protein n=1 Tax=Limnobaculum eriocheiris TaxID=2897391 RepID=A0A9X1MYR1_9GAMM|nr:hypothetical protein [Limnobaculum eriocheiris]MCD1127262.1 hypothetical protein [Limnobaculum eriocheiris]